jgi:ribosome-interacting GTPase 1
MPINAHPEYLAAEKEYHSAYTLEEKIEKLRKMIALAPKHKGAENLRKQLKTRLKKFLEKKEKAKKSGKSSSIGIKKEDMQAVILGFTNTGKSTLLSKLTNASPVISPIQFSTTKPTIGMIPYKGVNIQLIENPAIESDYYDKGLTNTADTLILIVKNTEQIKKIKKILEKAKGKQIIAYNLTDSSKEIRKISATLASKRHNFVIISTETEKGFDELKEKLFESFDKIRVYTKEPGKTLQETSKKPIILEPNSTVKDVAEKILKGFSKKVKQTKIWGPSSKFPGQKVGLKHKLKDKDIVEFKTF